MLQALRQPKWLIAVVAVVGLAAVFVRLGIWQLDRLEERRQGNAVAAMRLEADPVPLEQLLSEAGDDLSSIEYRRATATGVFDVTEEVLIRSQVELGTAGFHVITPLTGEGDDEAILVNRGWVPLTMDRPPVDAAPSEATNTVEGWIHLTETRPPLGAQEPEGDLDVLNRVDIDRISEQMSYDLAPVYLVVGEGSDDLPIPVDPPDFTDEGPHLAYAIQWFGFAAVGLIGLFFLVRRKGGQPTSARSSTTS